MNSKRIGNIGEAKVLCKFVEMGIPVYIPFGDNEPSDFIIELSKKLYKIQVKTSKKSSNGTIKFDLTSHNTNSYNENKIDYFACYSIARDKIYLINVWKAPNTTLTIRYEKSKNKQEKFIQTENNYLLKNVLNRLLSSEAEHLLVK